MMTTDERNAIIAEALEAAGFTELAWEVSPRCPQGHDGRLGDVIEYSPGQLCLVCCASQYPHGSLGTAVRKVEAAIHEHEEDLGWHPEWRFGRVAKPFHTSLDLTITALNALGMEWGPYDPVDDEWGVSRETIRWHEWAASNSPAAIAEALVACAVEVLRREREGMS